MNRTRLDCLSLAVHDARAPRGLEPVTFSASTLPAAGFHLHTFDPRFTTEARFHYTPVPEPATPLLLAALAGTGLLQRKRRLTTNN